MVFDVNGNNVSPHKISVTFWSFPELKQFQFIQEEIGYTVLITERESFNREDELIKKLKDVLGEEAMITIEKVESIPSLNSGKRKYIINKAL